MKIVIDGIIFQLQAYGGISRIFQELLPRMCDQEPEARITLLTEAGSLRQAPPRHELIRHCRVPNAGRLLRPSRVWSPLVATGRTLAQRFAVGSGAGAIWHSTYYTSPGRWRGARVVTVYDMVHEVLVDLFDTDGDRDFRERKRRVVAEADAVLCISAATAADLQHIYGVASTKVHIVHNAHSPVFRLLPAERRAADLPTDRPFLLYVGDRAGYKNFAALLDAYCAWSCARDVDLVLVGSAPLAPDEVRRLHETRLEESVRLLNSIDDQFLCELYNAAAAFVYPSIYEGFGIPLLEALACGCPVVASRIPSSVEVVGECPYYFEPDNRDSLIAALDAALASGREPVRQARGLAHAAKFSWDRTAERTLKVYRSVGG